MKTTEEYESKISELQLKIEDMEQTISIIYSLFLGILSYFQWHSWLISISITLVMIYVINKFIAEKPFTSGLNAKESNES